MVSYYEKLKDPRWQKKRLEIMARDKFNCLSCGDDESTFHVHHGVYNTDDPWDAADYKLITLCEACHSWYHENEFYKYMKEYSYTLFLLKCRKPKSVRDIQSLVLHTMHYGNEKTPMINGKNIEISRILRDCTIYDVIQMWAVENPEIDFKEYLKVIKIWGEE